MITPTITPVKYLNKVDSPVEYKDNNNCLHQFKELDDSLKLNFEALLKVVTLDADLTAIPTLEHFTCDKTEFSILNYTITPFKINEKRDLFAEDKQLIGFDPENCRLLIYQTKHYDDIFCLENKDDNKPLTGQRNFIVKSVKEDVVQYSFSETTQMVRHIGKKFLFSQIAVEIADVETFIKTDACMSNLVKYIAKEAQLKEKPSIIQYHRQNRGKPRLTILNHTDVKISFNIFNKLFADEKKIFDFNSNDCQMIVYHLEGHPEMICIDSQDEKDSKISHRIYANLEFQFVEEAECGIDFGEVALLAEKL